MSCDVEIMIFGKVSNPEAIWDLANAAAAEARINFLEDFEARKFQGMLEKAQTEGGALELTRRDTTNLLESVRGACQRAGLSYVVRYGDSGAEGFSNGLSWKPGMASESEFLINGKDPVVRLSDVSRAAATGGDAVVKLVDDILKRISVGAIEIAPGFAEAYLDYVGPETAPAL